MHLSIGCQGNSAWVMTSYWENTTITHLATHAKCGQCPLTISHNQIVLL